MQFHCRHSIVTDPVKGQPFNQPNPNAEQLTVRIVAELVLHVGTMLIRRTAAVPVRHIVQPVVEMLPDPLRPVQVPIV